MSSVGISLIGALLLASCALHEYDARPLEADPLATAFLARRLDEPELLALAHPAPGPGPSPMPSWDGASLTRVALALRPELEVARTAVEEARAAVVTAGARPNPKLEIDPEVALGADDPWILGWALAIPL